uniref:Uncharacterized protein LOC100178869 n=1 Tax=Phallusia mammillata TaxID=59560 RepID=A0A6F9DG82_9ASCI|nr:uncharacterized protein LOC100178869 [Phallusia mammillata]
MGNALEGQAASVDVVIIGGGPTGLGAAHRLKQYGYENWLLLDAEKYPGGLAGSVKTAEGFRFDHGYKTLVSHYDYFDRVIDSLYNEGSDRIMKRRERNNFVYLRERLVKYPVQNNLCGLPPAEKQACLLDLIKARLERMDAPPRDDVTNLDEHLVSEWGETLCNLFFRPYIFKAWAYPTGKLRYDWVDYKIAPSVIGDDVSRVFADEQKDPGWGVEATTMYPSKGGMIGLWRSLAKTLPKSNVRFKNEISQLDIENKKLVTKAGMEITYKQLVSTMPMTSLLDLAGRSDLCENMVNSSLFVVCLGLRGVSRHSDVTGCIYYPESSTLFHRAVIFSSHDPDSVPASDVTLSTIKLANGEQPSDAGTEKPGPYWSLLVEVSGGPLKTVSEATIVDDVIREACSVGLLQESDEIVSIHLTEMTHGYPLPTIASTEKIDEALGWLKSKDVWSRGRFGGFKYEVGDLDHCFIQGVEAVDNLLKGIPESCINRCDIVNQPQKSHIPVYDVEPLDGVVVSQLGVAELYEEGSVISDDTIDPVIVSDSEQSVINAGNVRNAITTEPNHVTDEETNQ